ncbi:oligopeptide/dipeptide ABC transporter ATP-binding protein [Spiroplasma endosymbiont of Aspidapion aeneum]|uniref:oligopeptide/dipeptide ABC transporter ATP-binding protein n=1 Tax=Spiroplasma endosymbiont of Aspidapion aeneum TaxID=3066276 RepID=UPI00313D916D
MNSKKILSFNGIETQFQVRGQILNTIRNIDFDIYDKELVAIVGESGSGKSVLTKVITSMIDNNGYVKSGSVKYYPTQEARDDVETGFREPIDFIDLHKAVVSRQTKLNFVKIISKQIKYLQKEIKIISNLNKELIETRLAVFKEKLDMYIKRHNLNSKKSDSIYKKMESIREKISRFVFLNKITIDEEFKEKTILELNLTIEKLKKEIIYYLPFSNEKKEILKTAASIYQKYISSNEYDVESLDDLSKQIQSQDFLFNWEKEIIKYNDEIKNKKVDIDELYIIINKYGYLGNKKHKNIRKGKKEIQKLRGATVAVIPQDPMTSLNPLLSVGWQICEVLRKHSNMSKKQARLRAIELLEEVGIANAKKRYKDIPGDYSGGMRQRVVIAIALACMPRILICDEPTTALDVTVQSTILKLIKSLQMKHNFTTIFITHDLGVVANIADRVAVMYAGQIIECGKTKEVYYNPQHPYTWALLSSLPQLGEKGEDLYTIYGNPPSLKNKIIGDAFAPRNEFALDIDFVHSPPKFNVSSSHWARTWLLDKRAPKINVPKKIELLKKKMSK